MSTTAQPQAAGTNGSTDPTLVPAERTAEDRKESKTALAIGNLPDDVKQAMILARQQNLVRAEIAATNWGKGIDVETRFRISEWATRVGIDPATELNVLGGTFYKNANYYLRRLSELENAGIVEYAYIDHIVDDPRLHKLAKDSPNDATRKAALEEIERRTMMRAQYNADERAKSIAVFHLKLTRTPNEFSACKWCGGGSRSKDPVGDEFPVETSETRAIRRTMRLVASSNPEFKPLVEPHDDDAIDAEIGDALREGLKRMKAAQPMMLNAGKLATDGVSDAYSGKEPQPAAASSSAPAATPKAAAIPDPFAPKPAPAAPPVEEFQDDRAIAND